MKDWRLALNILARIIAAFLGFIFLFGQLFFAIFELHSTAVGLGAFLLAGLTGWPVSVAVILNRIGLLGGLAVLVGLGVDVWDYYAHHNTPGNYYAWEMTIALALSTLYLMNAARRGEGLR